MDWDTQMMCRTGPVHPALLRVLALSRWVSPQEDTPPARQNIRLVTECVIEPGAVPPQENAPEVEDKSPDDGNDAPSDEQQTEPECEGDIVDLYAGTEEL